MSRLVVGLNRTTDETKDQWLVLSLIISFALSLTSAVERSQSTFSITSRENPRDEASIKLDAVMIDVQ